MCSAICLALKAPLRAATKNICDVASAGTSPPRAALPALVNHVNLTEYSVGSHDDCPYRISRGRVVVIRFAIGDLHDYLLDTCGFTKVFDRTLVPIYVSACDFPSGGRQEVFFVWNQRFSDPIILLGRKPLVTLRAQYIVKLPKAEQQATEWQTAAEVLMLIGEHGGDPMIALPNLQRLGGKSCF